MNGMKRFRDSAFQHPTVLPLIIIIFQELCFWKIIDIGDSCTLFLTLIVTLIMVIYFIGKFDRRKWTVPLFGLVVWDIVRLGNKRSTYPFLMMGILVLTLICLALLFIKKIKIVDKQGLWVLFIVFVVCIISMYDASETIDFNLVGAVFYFGIWLCIVTPGIILDVLFHQQFHRRRGSVCFSWVPIAIALSPIGELPSRLEPPFQFVGFVFWTITAIVFFLLIPILQSDSWGNKTRDIVTIIIATVTIAIVSAGKWLILHDPESLLRPGWFHLIEDPIRFVAPILLLFLYYRKHSKTDGVSGLEDGGGKGNNTRV